MLFLGHFTPKLSVESLIWNCFRKNFPEYPPKIDTNFNNSLFYSTVLLWVKNLTVLILKLVPGASFASVKSVFVDADLQLMMKMVAKSNTRT